jgi:NACalpha-BTF3-like transcription factor
MAVTIIITITFLKLTYQVAGNPRDVPTETPIPEEDIALVAEQT